MTAFCYLIGIKYGHLLNISVKQKNFNLLETFKLIKESKSKNVASQFGISVGAVGNVLKMKCENGNLGEPLG